MSAAGSSLRSTRRWTAVAIVLIALLVLLNAPQFLFKGGRDSNFVLHASVEGPDKKPRPECHLPISHLSIGPRRLFANRMVDIHFVHSGRSADCPGAYDLMLSAAALTHEEAFAVSWRSELEKMELRCPLQVEKTEGAKSRPVSFVTLDLNRKVSIRDEPAFDCLPRLSFIANTSAVSLERQILLFSNNVSFDLGAQAARQKDIEVSSREPLEDVNVRSFDNGRVLTMVLSDHRLTSVLAILNIVLSSLLGVASAALFSVAGRDD